MWGAASKSGPNRAARHFDHPDTFGAPTETIGKLDAWLAVCLSPKNLETTIKCDDGR
jgi:hypothetical protein